MKKDAKIVPIGCRPPRNAAAMPLKPIAGTADCATAHSSKPERNMKPAPMPASAPAIPIVRMRFCFSRIPQYFAAFLFSPVAFSS